MYISCEVKVGNPETARVFGETNVSRRIGAVKYKNTNNFNALSRGAADPNGYPN
jgi:hypothetical protein